MHGFVNVLGYISVDPVESFGDVFGCTSEFRTAFFRKIAEIVAGGRFYDARCQLYIHTASD